MEELMDILQEFEPGVDFEHCTDLIDGKILNSLEILSLVAEIEDVFDIAIPTVEIVPDNFNSAQAMWNMICRLQEEE